MGGVAKEDDVVVGDVWFRSFSVSRFVVRLWEVGFVRGPQETVGTAKQFRGES